MRSALIALNLAVAGAVCSPCYEKPPACTGSETSVQITGVTGDFCSPLCVQNECPKGDGSFTAKPSCVLETQGSSKPTQCALICTPGSNGACPAGATCQAIQGEGICTYPSSTAASAAKLSTSLAHSAAKMPTVTLNNGVEMPQLAAGTWQYDNATAADSIAKAWAAGFTHIDTAENYYNQVGVGKAIKTLLASGVKREEMFITTKTLPCVTGTMTQAECMNQTLTDFALDLELLGLPYVDLVLLHGPSTRGTSSTTMCDAKACGADLGSWQALEQAYAEKKVRAIGVSNYCQSCFECLLSSAKVVPAVNQIAFHVGMGDDPSGLVSYSASKGILAQACACCAAARAAVLRARCTPFRSLLRLIPRLMAHHPTRASFRSSPSTPTSPRSAPRCRLAAR